MKRFVTLIIVFSFVAAACGDDDTPGLGSTTTSVAATTPDTTTSADTTSADTTSADTTSADTSAEDENVESDTDEPAETTSAAPSEPREVSITTADGLALDATVYPGGPDWVVLAHMLPADKESWTDLAALFQGEGYTVLAYNNRGYGGSEGDREPFALPIDADAALEYARAQGARGIVFGGASMNGAAAMTLGAFYDFDAIFVLSGVPSFPSVEDAATQLPVVQEPILFVAAEDDGNAVANARSYAESAPQPELIVLPAGGHGTNMLLTNPDLGPQIVDWVVGAVRDE